jgi:hypothetical protein
MNPELTRYKGDHRAAALFHIQSPVHETATVIKFTGNIQHDLLLVSSTFSWFSFKVPMVCNKN